MRLAGTSLCALSLLLISLTNARATPEDSWNLSAGVGSTYDSNLFRSPSRLASSETTNNVSVGLKINKVYSLQRFVFDGVLTDYRFRKNDYLDYVGKNFYGAYLWSATPRLHGTLSASYSEGLNSFVDYRGRGRNLRTLELYRFDAEWEAWGNWRLLGGVNYTNVQNSELFLAQDDYSAKSVDYGVKYAYPSGSNVVLLGRRTDGDYDNRQLSAFSLLDSHFTQNETEARVSWQATGQSLLNARVGYLAREHQNFAVRDYSGAVGSLDYLWDIGGKFRLNLGLRQDLVSYQTLESSYYRARAWSIIPIWQVTAKTAVRGRFSRESRDYLGAPVALLSGREDTLSQSQVAVDWMPLRTLTLSTYVQYDTRDSNQAIYDFQAEMAGVSAKLAF